MLLNGMSTIVVTPPAAAARVAVSNPSHSVRPGSLTCTCVSTIPGDTTRSSALKSAASSNAPMRLILPSSMWTVAGRRPSGRTTRRLRNITVDLCVLGVLRVASTLESGTGCALQEGACPGTPHELAVLDDQAAARQHGVGGTGHLTSFVR